MDPHTAGLLVLCDAAVGILRDQHGTKWCRDRFMGPLRRNLDAAVPHISAELNTPGSCCAGVQEAADLVARACHACGKCALGRQ